MSQMANTDIEAKEIGSVAEWTPPVTYSSTNIIQRTREEQKEEFKNYSEKYLDLMGFHAFESLCNDEQLQNLMSDGTITIFDYTHLRGLLFNPQVRKPELAKDGEVTCKVYGRFDKIKTMYEWPFEWIDVVTLPQSMLHDLLGQVKSLLALNYLEIIWNDSQKLIINACTNNNMVDFAPSTTEKTTSNNCNIEDNGNFNCKLVGVSAEDPRISIFVFKNFRAGFPPITKHIPSLCAKVYATNENQTPCQSIEKTSSSRVTEESDFYVCQVPTSVWTACNGIWQSTSDGNQVFYNSVSDIAEWTKSLLHNLTEERALNLPFQLNFDLLSIHNYRRDILVITLDKLMVGVVIVKMPDEMNCSDNDCVLLKDTVIGEVFDYLKMIDGMYACSDNVIAIATTFTKYVIYWQPKNDKHFREPFRVEELLATNALKTTSRAYTKFQPWKLSIDSEQVMTNSNDQNVALEDDGDHRILHRTRVLHTHKEFEVVLQHLCTALLRMTQAQMNHSRVPTTVFKLHTNNSISGYVCPITFHSVNNLHAFKNLPIDMCTSESANQLIVLKDLGRGSTGKTWLCCSDMLTSVCTVKFLNDLFYPNQLTLELKWWKTIYGDIFPHTNIQCWSGHAGLMMPYLPPIEKSQREHYLDRIRESLVKWFANKGLNHGDVRWSNIGLRDNEPLMFDLDRVEVDKNPKWVNKAMRHLKDTMNH